MKALSRVVCGVLVLAVVLTGSNAYAQRAQFYVLDGFGGVHAGGGAAPVGGIPYFGFDIAKGIAYIPAAAGDGVVVLDGFGGVHPSTSLGAVAPVTPYFGFNIARAITYRNIPPRAVASSGYVSITVLSTTSSTFTLLQSVQITAPDDGFLLVTGSALVACNTGNVADEEVAQISVNVDATTQPPALNFQGYASFPSCATAASTLATNNQTLTHLFPVDAGIHTVNLLGRRHDAVGTGGIRILGRTISAVFIDHGSTGISAPDAPLPPGHNPLSPSGFER